MRGKFDAIFCRNVVIYFDEPTQQRIWENFVPRLTPAGALYIGHSERVSGPAAERLVSDGISTYRLHGGRSMKPVRVLVVDDFASMRALIALTLVADPGIQVIGQAADPLQAREAIKALNPDVMTLDVEMPKMNGLDFLDKVMRLRPLPVIMVSSLTERGAAATISAMEIGAIDCVGKPNSENPNAFAALAEKVKMARMRASACASRNATPARRRRRPQRPGLNGKIVAIGASTGGVEAVLAILTSFPQIARRPW